MPRRFFRKFAFKRHQLAEQWFMRPFRHLLHDDRLWHIRRKTVVPAFAAGLFSMWLPLPGHIILGCVLALLFRINLPVAAVTTLINNPLTMGPMYFSAYSLGSSLLQQELQVLEMDMSLQWLSHTFVRIWEPMVLGCFLLGTVSALIGYVTLSLLWRNSISTYKQRKRDKRPR